MAQSEVEGKFKTLTNGSKANATITQMAKTFVSLCAYADWTENAAPVVTIEAPLKEENKPFNNEETKNIAKDKGRVGLDLNYNIHIHLPATRDQAVYDALFASLAKHIPLK